MFDPTCPIAVKIRFLDVVQGLWIECQQILDLRCLFFPQRCSFVCPFQMIIMRIWQKTWGFCYLEYLEGFNHQNQDLSQTNCNQNKLVLTHKSTNQNGGVFSTTLEFGMSRFDNASEVSIVHFSHWQVNPVWIKLQINPQLEMVLYD